MRLEYAFVDLSRLLIWCYYMIKTESLLKVRDDQNRTSKLHSVLNLSLKIATSTLNKEEVTRLDFQGRECVLIKVILSESHTSVCLVDRDYKLADSGGIFLCEAKIAKLRWYSAIGEAIEVVGTAEYGKICSH